MSYQMDGNEVIRLFQLLKEDYTFPYELKTAQIQALVHLVNGENVALVASTGFGKTDVYTICPLLQDMAQPFTTGKHIVVVILPLIALIKDSFRNIKAKGVSVVRLENPKEMTAAELQAIKEGEYSLVLVTPEALFNIDFWRDYILDNPVYDNCVHTLVLDEAHVVTKWGKTFREAYSALAEIRSSLTKAKILFLSATFTSKDLKECVSSLQLTLPEVKVIAKLTDRPNIYLGIKSESKMKMMEELNWYIERLRQEKQSCPKCIIYVSSLNLAGNLYSEIVYSLGDDVYCGEPSSDTRMVFEYHGETEGKDQEKVVKDFSRPDGPIRLIIATVAFGMGINIPNIAYIVHWGSPDSVLDFWQEVGRAGRDGAQVYTQFYPIRLPISSESEEMRNLIKGIRSRELKCMRIFILKALMLSDADSDYICKLEERKGCTDQENCEKDNDCLCELCTCCTLCCALCPCTHKQLKPEKLINQ